MSRSRRQPTLQGIADELGVHVSTVSRVLNPRPGDGHRVASTETAERIRGLAAELGYRPNPHARSLRTQRSGTIAVLVPRLGDLLAATIVEGIEAAASDRGLSTTVAVTRDEPETQAIKARRWAARHPAVTCDDRVGGRLAAAHLLAQGRHEVGVLAGPPYASTAIDRTAGFVGRCADAGVTLAPERIVASGFDAASARLAADRLLDTRPTAVFAVDDAIAIAALGAIRDRGLVAGTHVALVGFNDAPLLAHLPVPLSSVRSPLPGLGRRAVDLLLRRIAGEPIRSERLPPELIVRATSGAQTLG